MTAAAGRYAGCKRLVRTDATGATVTYLAFRLLPIGSDVTGGRTATVGMGEVGRPDLLAFRTLQDPLLAYSIADANDAMDPLTLCVAPGRYVDLPGSGL